jgi:hypothetical protein
VHPKIDAINIPEKITNSLEFAILEAILYPPISIAIKLEENIDGSILKFFAIGPTTISIIDDSNGVIDSIPP